MSFLWHLVLMSPPAAVGSGCGQWLWAAAADSGCGQLQRLRTAAAGSGCGQRLRDSGCGAAAARQRLRDSGSGTAAPGSSYGRRLQAVAADSGSGQWLWAAAADSRGGPLQNGRGRLEADGQWVQTGQGWKRRAGNARLEMKAGNEKAETENGKRLKTEGWKAGNGKAENGQGWKRKAERIQPRLKGWKRKG